MVHNATSSGYSCGLGSGRVGGGGWRRERWGGRRGASVDPFEAIIGAGPLQRKAEHLVPIGRRLSMVLEVGVSDVVADLLERQAVYEERSLRLRMVVEHREGSAEEHALVEEHG